MPAKLTDPTAAECRSFGVLADDVAYLRRGCGLLVAPFKGGFRINRDVVSNVGLAARASAERAKRQPGRAATSKPHPLAPSPTAAVIAAPAAKPAPAPADTSAKCRCGDPINHMGRCWVRRGMSGPPPSSGRNPSTKARLAELERVVAELRAKIEGRA